MNECTCVSLGFAIAQNFRQSQELAPAATSGDGGDWGAGNSQAADRRFRHRCCGPDCLTAASHRAPPAQGWGWRCCWGASQGTQGASARVAGSIGQVGSGEGTRREIQHSVDANDGKQEMIENEPFSHHFPPMLFPCVLFTSLGHLQWSSNFHTHTHTTMGGMNMFNFLGVFCHASSQKRHPLGHLDHFFLEF